MNPTLASELEYVVVNGREKEPEQFFGVSQSVKLPTFPAYTDCA